MAAVALAGCASSPTHALTAPVPRSPHWPRATPKSAGIDMRAMDHLDLTGVTSLLVARHGRLVVERYYDGLQAADRVPVFSITKSVLSALIGIAIVKGQLSSVDEPLAKALPGTARRGITLGHLLSMTAGYGRALNFGPTDAASLANRPAVNPPGATFLYDSGSSDLLAAVLARATGTTAFEYAQTKLFAPLGIHDARWLGSQGGSGLVLRPRDLLAFGQLYLDDGRWNGHQLVPTGWVHASTRAHIAVPPGQGVTDAYGYGWWVETNAPRFYAAHGYLGQVLAIFPRLDEVVVVTSSGATTTLTVAQRVARATSPR